MSLYLYRLASWAMRRRRLVLGVWLVVLIGVIAISAAAGGKTSNTFTIPGTESQKATDLLHAKVPALGGSSTQVVFTADGSSVVTDPAVKATIQSTMKQMATVSGVSQAPDPFTSAANISPDKKVALGTVSYPVDANDVKTATLDKLKSYGDEAKGVHVSFNGAIYPGADKQPSELPELIGIIVAFIIMIIMFGALVSAGLPILTAILGVIATLMTVSALSAVVTIASSATAVATMLGLACGIDYCLFILSRHRNNLLAGMTVEESIPQAVATAGSAVVFAGLTVMIALAGLVVVGIPFLTIMGLGAAGAVLAALLIAVTLLPALLGFAGKRVVKFLNPPGLKGRFARVAQTAATNPERTFGSRWARFVVNRRIPVLIIGVGVLLVIAIPALGMHQGLPSGSSSPKDTTQRQAYDTTTEHFGAGFNGPLTIVTDVSNAQTGAAQTIAATIAKDSDVVGAAALPATNGVSIIRVVPKSGPNDQATNDLVNRLRDNRTSIEGSTGATYLVGGATASNIDVSSKLSNALPIFLIVVVGLAFVLLTFAFRTILVPLKSIFGFLLSVFAAFGAQVALFQWGWGAHIFGITKSETISFLPILMLAIIFGLSSDYELFVVSRIKEDFTKTGDAAAAVVSGTGKSARVVTSAALIMFTIFAAFMLGDDPITKAIGFSFAFGVFVDAFIVRLTLVPAFLSLVGSKIWYHPQWFARFVPDPDIEGHKLDQHLADAASKRELVGADS